MRPQSLKQLYSQEIEVYEKYYDPDYWSCGVPEWQAKHIVSWLSQSFGVDEPSVSIRRRRSAYAKGANHYHPRREQLQMLAPKGCIKKRVELSGLLHEYAHYISHKIFNQRCHGIGFVNALESVNEVYFNGYEASNGS